MITSSAEMIIYQHFNEKRSVKWITATVKQSHIAKCSIKSRFKK